MSSSKVPNSANATLLIRDIRREFGEEFRTLALMRGIAQGVPTQGRITMSNMYGKAASVPIGLSPPLTISDTVMPTETNLIASYFVQDTFGLPISYSIYSAPSVVSVSMTNTSNGLFTTIPDVNSIFSGNVVVLATNRFAKSIQVLFPFDYGQRPSVLPGMINLVGLSNVNVSTNLPSLFSNITGAALTFDFVSNPYSSGSISSSNLVVSPNYRNDEYYIEIRATNKYGTSFGSVPFYINEYAPISTLTNVSYPPSTMTNNTTIITGLSYGNGTYKVTSSPNGNNNPPYLAFDKNSATNFASSTGFNNGVWGGASHIIGSVTYAGPWILLSLPFRIKLASFSIAPQASTNGPQNITLLGTNDGITWSVVHTTGNTNVYSGTLNAFSLTNFPVSMTQYFSKYLLTWTSITATTGGYLARLAEFVLNT
jgi:hypothetical protein